MIAPAKIVIESAPGELRTATLDANGTPIEFRVERTHQRSLKDGLYLGRVRALRADIGAAFVDIGHADDGFLNLKESGATQGLHEGDALIVQVTRDAVPGKGPRLSAYPTLAGRYLVLTPGDGNLAISKKIGDAETRARLRDVLETQADDVAGFVVRTDALHAADEALLAEARALRAAWTQIAATAESAAAPTELYAAPDLAARTLFSAFSAATSDVVVDDADTLAVLAEFADTHLPEARPSLSLVRAPAFRALEIEDAFADALAPMVALPSGGRIVIAETAAMASIDVDAGQAGGGNPERVALHTNLEAAAALARQLRRRNIGGVIAVDFMRMKDDAARAKVLAVLKRALTDDPAQPRALPFSAFGIVEIERRRDGMSLAETMLSRTLIETSEARALAALRALALTRGGPVALHVTPDIKAALQGPLKPALQATSQRLGFDIPLVSDLHRGADVDFEIKSKTPKI